MFGSEQIFRKILQMAHDTLTTDVQEIAALLEGGDLHGAAHRLHGIKGFAPIFCGDALSTQIAEVERSSRADAIDRVRCAYRDLMPALTQWRNEIQHYLVGSGEVSRR